MRFVKFKVSSKLMTLLICVGLGFALAVQIHSNASANLQGLPQADLVRILDDVTAKNSRLEIERSSLEYLDTQLQSGSSASETALNAAEDRANALSILTGQIGAVGPGVSFTFFASKETIPAELLVGVLNELRDAGSEVIEIVGRTSSSSTSIRIVASSSIVNENSNGGFRIDGRVISAPITFRAIGDPTTLAGALRIAGGSVDQFSKFGSETTIVTNDKIEIKSLANLVDPRYARPQR